jgi:sulfite exporter TauE/SafE
MVAVLVIVAVKPWLPARPPLLAIGRAAKAPRLASRIATLLARGGRGAAPAIGLFTALLPCGWLWSFVALAAATKSSTAGALLMLAMWAGSLPALTSVGAVVSWLSRIAGTRARAIGSIALLVLAAVMVAGMVTRRAASADEEVPPCHRS